MICLDCKEECEEVEIRDGFYYDYGGRSQARGMISEYRKIPKR